MRASIKNALVMLVLLFVAQTQALAASTIDVVELKQANANKVVFKIRFNNGSISN